MNNFYLKGGALAVLALLGVANNALAQSATDATSGGDTTQGAAGAPSSGAGDIVVTATRQRQTLNKVPLSISAFTQATMDRQGVKGIGDIAKLTPGVIFSPNRTSSNIAIRGITSTAGAATTGIYLDDTPIQIRNIGYGGGTAYPQLFDLDRVEVLRGPQGTLFGAGAEGGTVRFLTPQPDLQKSSIYARGEVSAMSHGGPSGEIGVAVGAPIIKDQLAFRVSGWYRHDGGWINKVSYPSLTTNDKDSNWHDNYSLRGALTWEPVADLDITPSLFYQNTYSNASDFYFANFSNPSKGYFNNINPNKEYTKDYFVLPAVNMKYKLGGVDLIAVGSYFDRSSQFNVDYTSFDQSVFTGNPLPTIPGQNAVSNFVFNQKAWTGELRAQSNNSNARLKWVAGVFWSDSKQFARQSVSDDYFQTYIQNYFGKPYQSVFGVPLVDGNIISRNTYHTQDRQVAGYAQVDWQAIERLTLTAGVRVSRNLFDITALAEGPASGPTVGDVGSQKETPVTPKFGANFQVNEDHMLYVSASKGFRPGGYNPAVGTTCAAQLAGFGLNSLPQLYKSDSVWSYEAGAKSRFFARALQMQASVFRVDWSNIQQIVGLNSCGYQFVANLGAVRSQGFDLQTSLRVSDNLTLSSAVGYNNATFQQTVYAGPTATTPIAIKGDHVTVTPWTVYLAGEYTRPIGDGRKGYFRADYTYNSQQNNLRNSADPRTGGDATLYADTAINNVTLRAGVQLKGVDASIFVNNLLDSTATYGRYRYPSSQQFIQGVVKPRTIGVTVTYRG